MKKFRELREQSGLTQQQLADAVNRTHSTTAKWDQGVSFPEMLPSEMKRLMDALGCTLDELIEAEFEWRGLDS